jgi:hypothetical protein
MTAAVTIKISTSERVRILDFLRERQQRAPAEEDRGVELNSL